MNVILTTLSCTLAGMAGILFISGIAVLANK